MDLRALEYFVAVAEERHFTRAAARVHVSQSGLSATVRSLEAELHTSLFERTTRRVELTAAGEALLPEARRTLASARAGVEAVHAVEGLERGRVTVGVMQQMNLIGLPRTLARFHQQFPGVEIRLSQGAVADLHHRLGSGELDLAIASPPEPPDPRFAAVELYRTRLAVVCRDDDPLATSKTVTVRQLVRRNLVGFPQGWKMRDLAEQAMRKVGVHLDFNLEANDVATLLDLVEAGLGIAVSAPELNSQRRRLRAVPLAGPPLEWVVSALTAASRPTNPAARELWQRVVTSPSRDS